MLPSLGLAFFFFFFLLDLVTFQTPLGDKNCSKVTGNKSSNFVWSQGKCWHWQQQHFRDKLIWKYYYITSPSQSQSTLLVSLSASSTIVQEPQICNTAELKSGPTKWLCFFNFIILFCLGIKYCSCEGVLNSKKILGYIVKLLSVGDVWLATHNLFLIFFFF